MSNMKKLNTTKKRLAALAAIGSSAFLLAACEPGTEQAGETGEESAPTYGEPGRSPTTPQPGEEPGSPDMQQEQQQPESEPPGLQPGASPSEEESPGAAQQPGQPPN